MYWTDWEEDEVNDSIGRIEKAWMDGSHRKIFVTSNMLWPNGLALDHGSSTMYWCDAYYDHIERIFLNGTGRMVGLMKNCHRFIYILDVVYYAHIRFRLDVQSVNSLSKTIRRRVESSN